jgi:hypothetical protein
MVSVTVVEALVHPFTVCVAVYVYVPAAVCPVAKGLPLKIRVLRSSYHWMFVPAAVRLGIVLPKQALLFAAAGAGGIAFTVTEVVPAGPVHPRVVAVTE